MKIQDKNTGQQWESIAACWREMQEKIFVNERQLQRRIKDDGCYDNGEVSLYPVVEENAPTVAKSEVVADRHRIHDHYTESELEELIALKASKNDVEVFDIKTKPSKQARRVAVSLLSDVHIEEKIEKESVLGLNFYDEKEAKRRLVNYFERLVKMMNRNKSDELVLGCLGDFVSNNIHPELMQTNTSSPLEAVQLVKGCIISGLEYLLANLDVEKITVISVCGNHDRTVPKKQYSNFTKVNYAYFMFLDIADRFKDNDRIEFILPKSEMCITTILGKRILWHHGDAARGGGNGVAGHVPTVMRWFAKMNTIFHIDLACIGHYHVLSFLPKVITNGSIVGYSSFAMSHGFPFEEPAQAFFIIDNKHGYRMYAPIYVK